MATQELKVCNMEIEVVTFFFCKAKYDADRSFLSKE